MPVGEAPAAAAGCGVTGEMEAGEGSGAPAKSAKSGRSQRYVRNLAEESIPSSLAGVGGFWAPKRFFK